MAPPNGSGGNQVRTALGYFASGDCKGDELSVAELRGDGGEVD